MLTAQQSSLTRNTRGQIPFIRILRGGFLIGSRHCHVGDVFKVLDKEVVPVDANGVPALMPIVPEVDHKKAHMLIDMGVAEAEMTGPERFSGQEPQTATLKDALKAERAVAPPQRGGKSM